MLQDLSVTVADPTQDAVWRAHYATPRGLRYWPSEELVRSLADRHVGTVLEVGCGNGANLWCLAEHAAAVFGLDVCETAISEARKYMARRGAWNVVIQAGDLRQLPFSDASVDAVVDVYASQHVTWADHALAYAEYRRVLRPGGWFFLQHFAEGTTIGGARLLEPYTYDALPLLFPGVSPACVASESALLAALDFARLRPASARSVERRTASGARVVYAIVEGEATT